VTYPTKNTGKFLHYILTAEPVQET